MKKFLLSLLVVGLVWACNSSDKKAGAKTGDQPTPLVDSLLQQIDDGHMLGMSKIGKLHMSKQKIETLVDSIGKLPAAAQTAAAAYVARLKQAIQDLDYADVAMDKWMMEYNEDSAKDNAQAHIEYLRNEALKVDKMKAAILTSMQNADSLLKAKF